jgi:serine/threonine protein kinase
MYPEDDMPRSFFCPVTGEVLVDPVLAGDGHTYERRAIQEWLRRSGQSPVTRHPLDEASLQPNIAMRNVIREWNDAITAGRRDGFPQVRYMDIDFSGFQDKRPSTGSFKQVVRGHFKGCDVAVAACRNGASLGAEASMLHRLGRHPRIIKFLGMAKDLEGVEHLVTEWARFGSLASVLSDMHEEGVFLQPCVQLAIVQQVCEAMQALVCSEMVHRDLACLNVLVFSEIRASDPSSVDVKVCYLLFPRLLKCLLRVFYWL